MSIYLQEQGRSHLSISEKKYIRNTAPTYISNKATAANISQKHMSELLTLLIMEPILLLGKVIAPILTNAQYFFAQ